jgi:2-amino-4-hydroxy-6-hydroxymethyldihydropteridine diphosphokinase
MNKSYLLLGTNLGNRLANLQLAKTLINEKAGEIVKVSSVYESEPWGYHDANSYYNQAVCISTNLNPRDLLSIVLSIESEMGRTRSGIGYDARIIDIDILFYESVVMNNPTLKIPHPRLQDRMFVLKPLSEIAEKLVHPVLKVNIQQLTEQCSDSAWVKKLR